ncbi:MAG: hypothetical protein J1G38_04855 [Clostridiales bacterium]|nr:hypothetical protein [Clostridiales bacterium]
MIEFVKAHADLYRSLDILSPFDENSPQSAFLLIGEDADGLSIFARFLAAKLLGISENRALDGHADIMVYPKSEGSESIERINSAKGKKSKKADTAKTAPVNVDDVRDILDSLYLTPFELKRRAYIIENAESMSEICQNKLLKSLEEPPKSVCFILCAGGALLPTVESRCTKVELPPFSVRTVYDRLSAVHPDNDKGDIALAARASRGNMGMAERILRDPDFGVAYADAVKILKCSTGSKVFASVAAVYDKFTREHALVVLGIMEYLLGDIARMSVGADTVFDKTDVGSCGIGFTPYAAARSAEFVRDAARRLQSNCMPQAVMDRAVLKIMEEKALCQR